MYASAREAPNAPRHVTPISKKVLLASVSAFTRDSFVYSGIVH